MRRNARRGLALGLVVTALSFGNFTRIPGSECVRAIHIVTLMTCGAGLGVAIVCLIMMIRGKRNGE